MAGFRKDLKIKISDRLEEYQNYISQYDFSSGEINYEYVTKPYVKETIKEIEGIKEETERILNLLRGVL